MKLSKPETPATFSPFGDEFAAMMGMLPWPWSNQADERAAALAWQPRVDVKEESDRYLVRADVPGVDPKDIEITLDDGVLTLRGERKEEVKDEKEGYRRVERFSGRFFRRFTLPERTDPDKVGARADKGVLEISIPKAKSDPIRRIRID